MSNQTSVEAIPDIFNRVTANVFSSRRTITLPDVTLPKELKLNHRIRMDGLSFLNLLPQASFPVAFLDPQYRGILDKLKYGNEGKQRGKKRFGLPQMDDHTIAEFIQGIDKALIPSGHLFLWIDKFHLCQDFKVWLDNTQLDVVDMITWNKQRMGMGYRTRRTSEYLIALQKQPCKAKGVWKAHNIPDVWPEKIIKHPDHPHAKPINLQGELIAAVTNEGDIVIDPCAGSFSVLESASLVKRNFLGCDINGFDPRQQA